MVLPFPQILLEDPPPASVPELPEGVAQLVPVWGEDPVELWRRSRDRVPWVFAKPGGMDSGEGPLGVLAGFFGEEAESRELLAWAARGGALEVHSLAFLQHLGELFPDPHSRPALVLRGSESRGPHRECSAFLLAQESLALGFPTWIAAPLRGEALSVWAQLGASGAVLPGLDPQGAKTQTRVRVELSAGWGVRLARVDAEEKRRLEAEAGPAPVQTFRRLLEAERLDFARVGASWGEDGLDRIGVWADCFRGPHVFGEPRSILEPRSGGKWRVHQGPLSRISTSAELAQALAEAGALPHLALAGMGLASATALLEEVRTRGIPFGVGILALGLDRESFRPWIDLLVRSQPDRVLVAAPRLDQLEDLQRAGIAPAVHAPSPEIFQHLFELGIRDFVLEGEEAGGHISSVPSLDLWQGVLEFLRTQPQKEEVHLSFAGGIADRWGASFVANLVDAYQLFDRISFAVQVGTAWLASPEFEAKRGLNPEYRQELLRQSETLVTGEALGLRVRQLATDSIQARRHQDQEILAKAGDFLEKKDQIEAGYVGSLTRAVEGSEAGLKSFMAGAVAGRLRKERTLRGLVEELEAAPRPAWTQDPELRQEGQEAAGWIAVTGAGAVLPGNSSVRDFEEGLLKGRCGLRELPPDRWESEVFFDPSGEGNRTDCLVGGFVDDPPFDSARFRIPPRAAAEMDRSQKFALLAAQEALEDARVDLAFEPRDRAAVLLGNSMGGDRSDQSVEGIHQERLLEKLRRKAKDLGLNEALASIEAEALPEGLATIGPDTLPGELSNVISGRIAWVFDLLGRNGTSDAACASSLAALAEAIEELRSHRADLVLTGGVDTQTDAGIFVKFSKLQALNPRGSFPFDTRGEGFVLGEGAGVFLLRRFRDSLRRGETSRALILGWGASSDGSGQGITAPRAGSQVLALRRALRDAKREPDQVDAIECHGTGTELGDRTELDALTQVFAARPRPLVLGSVKAQVGHLKAGAGAAGMLRAMASISGSAFFPQVNFQEPKPELAEQTTLEVRARPRNHDIPRPTLGVSSFGFGGTNYHLLLERAPVAARKNPKLRYPWLPKVESEVAFLFPGQGSQAVGMLQSLRQDPLARTILARADACFERLHGEALSAKIYPEEGKDPDQALKELTDTAVAQPAIFTASAILLAKLDERGIHAGMMIGHSLGEYSALYAAGCLSFEEALEGVSLRGLSMRGKEGEPRGAMAFLALGERETQERLEAVEGLVVLANLNSFAQTVVSGEVEAVQAVVQAALQDGIRARRLNVSAAFHSPLVAATAAEMRTFLESCELPRPRVPVPSNLRGEVYPAPSPEGDGLTAADVQSKISDFLSRQLEEPVDFIGQVEFAYAAGIRRFVEVGPRDVLTRLVPEILGPRGHQALALDPRREDPGKILAELEETLQAPLTVDHGGGGRRRRRRSSPPASSPAPRAPARPAPALEEAPEDLVYRVLAEVTGYQRDQIELDQDLEEDLGIDSLKTFEIFARLRESFFDSRLPDLGKIRTLRQLFGARPRGRLGQDASSEPSLWMQRERWKEGSLPEAPGRGLCVEVSGELPNSSAWEELFAPASDPGSRNLVWVLPRAESASKFRSQFLVPLRDRLDTLRALEASLAVLLVGPWGPGSRASAAALRSVAKDHPKLKVSIRHLEGLPAQGIEGLGIGSPVFEARVESSRVRVPILESVASELPEPGPGLASMRGRALVTGGTGGLGEKLLPPLLRASQVEILLWTRGLELPGWAQEFPGRVTRVGGDLTGSIESDAKALGPIDWWIHGAGREVSGPFCERRLADLDAVWEAKAGSFERLREYLDLSQLRGWIAWTSISGVLGNHGQADYAAANAWLDASELPEAPRLALAWTAWDGVGMARDPGIREILEARGLPLLPATVGVRAFLGRLESFLRDPQSQSWLISAGVPLSFALEEDSLLESSPQEEAELEARIEIRRHRIDLKKSPYLADHRLGGKLYLPAVSIFRQLLKTGLPSGPDPWLEVTDLRWMTPVVLEPGQDLRVRVEERGPEVQLFVEEEGNWRPTTRFSRQRIAEIPGALEEEARALAQAFSDPTGWGPPKAVPAASLYRTLFHGESFRVLDRIEALSRRGLLAIPRWPPPGEVARDWAEPFGAPSFLEAVFHAAGAFVLAFFQKDHFVIPKSIDCLALDLAGLEQNPVREILLEPQEGSRRFRAFGRDQAGQIRIWVEGLEMSPSPHPYGHREIPIATPGVARWMDFSLAVLSESQEPKEAVRCLAHLEFEARSRRSLRREEVEVFSEGRIFRADAPGLGAQAYLLESEEFYAVREGGRSVAQMATSCPGVAIEPRTPEADLKRLQKRSLERSLGRELPGIDLAEPIPMQVQALELEGQTYETLVAGDAEVWIALTRRRPKRGGWK